MSFVILTNSFYLITMKFFKVNKLGIFVAKNKITKFLSRWPKGRRIEDFLVFFFAFASHDLGFVPRFVEFV